MPPSVSPGDLTAALVAESARKSRVCWLSWDGAGNEAPRLVWHAWYDGALLVLSGDEQVLPGIASAGTVEVVMRSKDTGGRLVTWTGSVDVVDPASPSWAELAAALLGVRLNLPDPRATEDRWRTSATLVRVVPLAAPGDSEPGPLP